MHIPINISFKRTRAIILICTISLLQSCAGYIEYKKGFSTVDQFGALYADTKSTPYNTTTRYYDAKISKQEVLNSWGDPYAIEVRGGREFGTSEIWMFHRGGIAMRGIAPIVLIPVPLPLIWWPEGWDTTYVKFKDDIVISAWSSDYSFNDGYVCLLIICTDYPIDLH